MEPAPIELKPLIDEPIYTVRESALLTRLAEATIWDYIKKEKLKPTHSAYRVFIRRSELMKLIDMPRKPRKPKAKKRGAK